MFLALTFLPLKCINLGRLECGLLPSPPFLVCSFQSPFANSGVALLAVLKNFALSKTDSVRSQSFFSAPLVVSMANTLVGRDTHLHRGFNGDRGGVYLPRGESRAHKFGREDLCLKSLFFSVAVFLENICTNAAAIFTVYFSWGSVRTSIFVFPLSGKESQDFSPLPSLSDSPLPDQIPRSSF